MATFFRQLVDPVGNYILPVTRAEGIYFSDDSIFSKLSFFPVGSSYLSVEDTSPSEIFGGTWEKIENCFLLGSGTRSAMDTGGEESHTLTSDELPPHSHTYNEITEGSYGGGPSFAVLGDKAQFGTGTTSESGSGIAHNNMPPYFVVHMWRRVS